MSCDLGFQLILAVERVLPLKVAKPSTDKSHTTTGLQQLYKCTALYHQTAPDCSRRRRRRRRQRLLLHPFNGLFSRTTWVSQYQKRKTSLDLNEARDGGGFGMQWHQLDHMQANCTSLQRDNHTYTPSLNFYRLDALPDAQPTMSKHWRQQELKTKPKLQQKYCQRKYRVDNVKHITKASDRRRCTYLKTTSWMSVSTMPTLWRNRRRNCHWSCGLLAPSPPAPYSEKLKCTWVTTETIRCYFGQVAGTCWHYPQYHPSLADVPYSRTAPFVWNN